VLPPNDQAGAVSADEELLEPERLFKYELEACRALVTGADAGALGGLAAMLVAGTADIGAGTGL